ncbi:MAG: hypothetical protein QOC56_116 [Alphaproteobacteria bacterium]|nr:hypothetical protein [Alphaproteobacteria bacterium]
MRVLIGMGALLAILAADALPAHAAPRPWCLREGFSGPGNCLYQTFEQCMASARGTGGACIENTAILWKRYNNTRARQGQPRQDGRW